MGIPNNSKNTHQRHHSDWCMGVKQSSQPKLDSQATGWTIISKPCACSQTYQTKSGLQLNRDWHGTRTSWPSTTIQSQTQGLPSRRSHPKESNGRQQRSYPREARPKLGRTLQNYIVAKERHIPPQDTRRAKATPSMKHRASNKILPVESDIQHILTLFTFCQFNLIIAKFSGFLVYYLDGLFSLFKFLSFLL